MFNDKKGMAMSTLVKMIIPLIVLVIIGIALFPKFNPMVSSATELADFGDCDKDKVQNYFDKCPCITTLSDESEDLRGCPKGTSVNKSNWDQQTCNWFITNLEDPEKDPVESCGEDNESGCAGVGGVEGVYKTRCGHVGETAIELPTIEQADEDAVTINTNVALESLTVNKWDNPNWLNSDLFFERAQGPSTSWSHKGGHFNWIQIKPNISNTGNIKVANTFNVEVQVCNSAGTKCKRKNLYDSSGTDSHGAPTGTPIPVYSVNGLDVNESDGENKFVQIGYNGDYCDGLGDHDCLVKLKIYGIKDIDKTDNEISFVFKYTDQIHNPKMSLTWYQLEFVVGNNGDNDEYDNFCQKCTISQAKNKFYKKWGAHHGAYPDSASGNNCVIFAVDDDGGMEDLGSGEVQEGFILHADKSVKLSLTNVQGEVDAYTGVQKRNAAAQTDGDVICYNNAWYWCSKSSNDELVVVGNDYYVCNNLNWIKRQ